jgi:hypothetical protein
LSLIEKVTQLAKGEKEFALMAGRTSQGKITVLSFIIAYIEFRSKAVIVPAPRAFWAYGASRNWVLILGHPDAMMSGLC